MRYLIFCVAESECLEATAQFDFMARSERELSFKKGDNVILFSQVSGDWWRGSVNGQEGLIPDKYIMLKIKWVLFTVVLYVRVLSAWLLCVIL